MRTRFQTAVVEPTPIQEMDKPTKRLRVCSTCHKTFKRTEHCLRHERAHNRERPFSCRFCERAYGRKDLLVRHEKTLHADAWAKAQESIQLVPDTGNRPARRRACRTTGSKNNVDPHCSGSVCVASPQEGQEIVSSQTPAHLTTFPSPHATGESGNERSSASRNGTQFDFSLPLTPELPDGMDIISGRTVLQQNGMAAASHEFRDCYSFDQQPVIYGSRMQIGLSGRDSPDAPIPLDPNLPTTLPGQSAGYEPIDFLSLVPDSELNQASFSNYLAGLESQSSSPESVSQAAAQMQWLSSSRLSDHESPDHHLSRKDDVTLRLKAPLAHLPRLIRERIYNSLPVILDQNARAALMLDLTKRMRGEGQLIDIPSAQTLQRFIKQFFNCFNSHLPIFHIPSFHVAKVPSPLILAMCSIGALYHLERKTAVYMRDLANEALKKTHVTRLNHNAAGARPLWEVQCKLLIITGAAFGGDAAAVSSALEDIGIFHREYSLRRASLSPNAAGHDCSTWTEWIERESSKRLLYGIFIVSSLLTITYNLSPCFSTTHDLDLEMPDEERLWNAPSEERWNATMASRSLITQLNIKQALTQLIFGKEFDLGVETRWPAFATTIMMHTVNIHMWHVTQCTQSFTNFSIDLKMEEQMKGLCTAQVEAALARCHRVLTMDGSSESEHTWDDTEGPLVFNGLALLRSCYVRAFTGSCTFNRTMLFSDSDVDIFLAARDYVQIVQVRTPFLTKAVAQVFAGLLTPIRAGHLLVRKTAAFSWSIEHAIAAWDCAIFYTKWVHTIEMQQSYAPPDSAERENLKNLEELLNEVDSERGEHSSLAAEVARAWATFLDDVWVWEVTWRMGKLLRKLADVYEEDCRVHQNIP